LKSPLISIITISLNAEKYLDQTIQSVLNQTYKNIEYIVVDGGSTDGTLGIIEKYKNAIDHIISEKDEGIADAMNKGSALSTGEYIFFLHSDDYFKSNNILEKAIEFFHDTSDIITCNIQFGKKFIICKPRGFNFWFNFKQGIYHQGTFCRKTLIEKLNGFDKEFRIAMDYDFFLRAYQSKARLEKIPIVLTIMRDTGISSQQDWGNLEIRFDEERRVHQKNCRSVSMKILYKIYWFLYLPYRRLSYVFKTKAQRCKINEK
jgi:glycosyltransferase involved in cell wall biosynthesis